MKSKLMQAKSRGMFAAKGAFVGAFVGGFVSKKYSGLFATVGATVGLKLYYLLNKYKNNCETTVSDSEEDDV